MVGTRIRESIGTSNGCQHALSDFENDLPLKFRTSVCSLAGIHISGSRYHSKVPLTIKTPMIVKVVNEEADIPDAMVDGKPTLVYWNIVGLALPIRLALVYAGVDFADIRIDAGDPTSENYNKAYPKAKFGKLFEIFSFPNLPYYLDGDVMITQTNAILRFIARKYNMVSPKEHMTDMYCDQLTDLEAHLVQLIYVKGVDALMGWYKKSVPRTLSRFSKLLKEAGSPFLIGTEPHIDDFKLYTFLQKMQVLQEQLGSDDTKDMIPANLLEYMKRIEDLPKVKEYLASSDHLAKPINNPNAKWVGS